ncbi:MFS transporter [Armatimonas sp.]|uniref:MFS transporter n=1 Tax=Armatimonas sp. TaxID=1872638 RepID=UPI0037514AED
MSKPTFQDKPFWYLGTGAYWFVTSLKWFVLFLLQPLQVAEVVPGGEKNGAWGMIVAIGAFEAMIGPALMGWLSDRTQTRFGRRRPFLAIGAALTSVALLLLGQANSLVMMAIAYLFLQISDDVATGPYAALIYDQVPENHRGKASGIMSMLQLIAQIVAVGIGLGLGKIALIYVAVAVINVICALITLAIWHEPAAEAPLAAIVLPKLSIKSWIEPFRSPDFRWVWLARFLVAFGFYLILLYVSNYLSDRVHSLTLFGFDLKTPKNGALAAALGISLSGAIGSGIAARLTDSLGRKKIIGLAGWVMAAALIPFALIPNFTVIFCVALVFGSAYGIYLSASLALAADVLPDPEAAAKDMGIWQASVSTPQVLTGAVGLLVDAGNRLSGGMGYTLAFLISSAAFLTGCLLVTRVKGSS